LTTKPRYCKIKNRVSGVGIEICLDNAKVGVDLRAEEPFILSKRAINMALFLFREFLLISV
jgi:hypothetical protein